MRLRRIGYRNTNTGKRYEFLTNHFCLSTKTISDGYKERWKIEILFREVKQNLHIKSFVGRSKNTVFIQIYTVLTVYLLMAYHNFLVKLTLLVQQLFELICLNLFGKDSLEELLTPRRLRT